MGKNFEKPPLSKEHIFWTSLVIGLLFTYAGVEENLLEVFTHLDFIINFILNFIEVYLLMCLTYYLYFIRKLNFWIALLISLGVFYLIESLSYTLFDYDTDDITEFFSLTLPFGSLIILVFNLIYHLLRRRPENMETISHEVEIWFDTISGRTKVLEKNIQYAYLTETYLEIHTYEGILKAFYSLKQFENLLTDKSTFFRLNKQCLGQRKSVLSFKSLSDGRLEISLLGGHKSIVSKNKASSFKKWLDES